MNLGNTAGYELLDSGAGQRLERFGARVIARPSSLAVWKQRQPTLWTTADAGYDHDQGWLFSGPTFEEWDIQVFDITLALRLQRNGQIGFFPEHTLYLEEVKSEVHQANARLKIAPTLLNLFAYSGMATVVAAKAGAQVTHIDMLKPALDWARTNAEKNGIAADKIKLIPEEALTYLEREVKRGKKHDIIILDPPSFSRISKSKTWDLPEVLPQIIESLGKILSPGGCIFFTSHGAESGASMTENLLLDALSGAKVSSKQLLIPELNSPRHLPAGYLVTAKT